MQALLVNLLSCFSCENVVFKANVRIGGAVALNGTSRFTFENCRFVSNVASSSGGGVNHFFFFN